MARILSDKGSDISTNASDRGLTQEVGEKGRISRIVLGFSHFSVFLGFSLTYLFILAAILMYWFGFGKLVKS